MAEEQFGRIERFRSFIKTVGGGAAVPSVAEEDLRRLHAFCVEMSKRSRGKDGVITLDTMAQICSSGAHLPAVWLRHTKPGNCGDMGQLTNGSMVRHWTTQYFGLRRRFRLMGSI
jgi:hypothetical protein